MSGGSRSVGRLRLLDADGGSVVVSWAAFRLHAGAIVRSVVRDQPGFVPSDYLRRLQVGVEAEVAELQAAGLWLPDGEEGGYRIEDPVVDDLVRLAGQTR